MVVFEKSELPLSLNGDRESVDGVELYASFSSAGSPSTAKDWTATR